MRPSGKLSLCVGDIVETAPGYVGGWSVRAKVLEVDSHLFEYDTLRVEQLDSVYLPAPQFWISERNVSPLFCQKPSSTKEDHG